MVVAMVFVMVLVISGIALFWLINSETRSTEMERTDLKSFNVAEAGVDAGMLALKEAWPSSEPADDTPFIDSTFEAYMKTLIQGDPELSTLWDPSHPDRVLEFIQLSVYDNSLKSTGATVSGAPVPTERVNWDSNRDGLMFVDATANVGDDRHRILIMAQRQYYPVLFSANLALYAGATSGNPGIRVLNAPGSSGFYDVDSAYESNPVNDKVKKSDDPCLPWPNGHQLFEDVVPTSTSIGLEQIARANNTYFTSADEAKAFFQTAGPDGRSLADGQVIYVKSNTAVSITGNTEVGSVAHPTVVVFDTPDGSQNVFGAGGTTGFTGVVICLGNTDLWGTSGIRGSLFCKGNVHQSGLGTNAEITYDQDVLNNLNTEHTISVSIVPNTWEENKPAPVTTTAP